MPRKPQRTQGRICVGIGGWNYPPWRTTFYPSGTAQARELDYASRHVTSIEINSTFYRLQKPTVFAKWHDATPDGFVFAVKAPRFIVQRSDLATAGPAAERFFSSGITELKAKLGPILWQLGPTKTFEPGELDEFLSLLPATAGKLPLRHALEVRHSSFMTAEFLSLARKHDVAVVCVDDAVHPGCADLSSNFVYARLRRCIASVKTGYTLPALKRWALRAHTWAEGREPTDLPRITPAPSPSAPRSPSRSRTPLAPPSPSPSRSPRDVFMYFINGAKERAPAAAQKLLSLLA